MKAERVANDKVWRTASCQNPDCCQYVANDGTIGSRSIEAVSRWAKRHTEKTGHTVDVETIAFCRYRAG